MLGIGAHRYGSKNPFTFPVTSNRTLFAPFNKPNEASLSPNLLDLTNLGTNSPSSGTATVVGDTLVLDSCGSSGAQLGTSTDSRFIQGQTYRIEYTISNYSAGDINFSIGNKEGYHVSANGTYVDYVTYNASPSPGLARSYIYCGGFSGTISNASIKHVKSYAGQALEFDGISDHFSLPSIDLNSTGDFTFAVWLNLDDVSDGGKLISGPGGFEIAIDSVAGKLRVYSSISASSFQDMTHGMSDGTWHRIVYTQTGTSAKLYNNGTLISTATQAQQVDSGTNYEGYFSKRHSSNSSGYVACKACDLQMWDAAWTDADVTYDYFNPEDLALTYSNASFDHSNLLAWYPMTGGYRGRQFYLMDASNTGLGTDVFTSSGRASMALGTSINKDDGNTGWVVSGTLTAESGGFLKLVSEGSTTRIYDQLSNIAGKTLKIEFDYRSNKPIGMSSDYFEKEVFFDKTSDNTGVNLLNDSFTSVSFLVNSKSSGLNWWGQLRLLGTHENISSTPSAGDELHIKNIKTSIINDKNHSTSVFHGNMLNLFSNSAEVGGTFYNDAHSYYDFTQQSTASGTDGWNIRYADGSSGTTTNWTTFDCTALIETDNSSVGLELVNTATAFGNIRTSCTTDAGKKYKVTLGFYAEDESFVTATAGTYLFAAPSSGQSTYLSLSSQADSSLTSLSGTFTATGSTLHLTIMIGDNDPGDKIRLKTLEVYEVGFADGWSSADAQPIIPQTFFQKYNELCWFVSALSNYATIGDQSYYTFGNGTTAGEAAFSLSSWVFMQDATNFPIMTKATYNSGGTDALEWGLRTTSDDYLAFILYNNGVGINDTITTTSAALTDYEGQWIHIAATYDGSRSASGLNLYLNGSLLSTSDGGSGTYAYMNATSSDMYIGRDASTATSKYAEGCVTEFSIWDKELSLSEIEELFNNGEALDCSNHSAVSKGVLQGYWRNQAHGLWKDFSSNSNNATGSGLSEFTIFPNGHKNERDSQGFIMNTDDNAFNSPSDTSPAGLIYLGAISTISAGTAFSVSCWLKTTSSNNNHFFGHSETDFMRIKSSSQIEIHASNSEFVFSADSGTPFAPNHQWVHFTLTRDSSNNAIMYINGEAQADTETLNADFDYSCIGARNGSELGSVYEFRGSIDDFTLYSIELTAAQVKKNYDSGKRGHRN